MDVRDGRAAFRACLESCHRPEVFPYACSILLVQVQNQTDHPQAPFATLRQISYHTTAASSTYPILIWHRHAQPHSTTHTGTRDKSHKTNRFVCPWDLFNVGFELHFSTLQQSNQLCRLVALNTVGAPCQGILPTRRAAFIHNNDCACLMAFRGEAP